MQMEVYWTKLYQWRALISRRFVNPDSQDSWTGGIPEGMEMAEIEARSATVSGRLIRAHLIE
jgi:hypothetical protein